jgi:4-amino-4-deoxy-L-arabinose transferase-like glycosyltransferase
MNKSFTRNPWILFLPFLVFYACFIVINKWPVLFGDEIRYVDFAHNLIHGFYSPPAPHINLWNGPGYPILLLPFIALKIPILYIKLLNSVFLYMALVFLYKALRIFANHKIAIVTCLLLAIYPNVFAILPILYTEAFTGFLVSAFTYIVVYGYNKKNTKFNTLASLILGYLILTKIIFGYVIFVCIGVVLLAIATKKNRQNTLAALRMLVVAFAVSAPYLAYTYHITGKLFYWGNSGGMSLYWMSSPYENEYGDWKMPNLTNNQYPVLFKTSDADLILRKNHSKEISFILAHNEVEQDALFKKMALDNIKKNPLKFLVNYGNNFSRMLFNFPYSYSYQDAAIVRNIITGSLILWASVTGIVLTCLNWRKVAPSVKLLLLITSVYLLLSGALSAYPRQLDVMMPILLFWLGYLAFHMKKLNLKFSVENSMDDELIELTEAGVVSEDSIEREAF